MKYCTIVMMINGVEHYLDVLAEFESVAEAIEILGEAKVLQSINFHAKLAARRDAYERVTKGK